MYLAKRNVGSVVLISLLCSLLFAHVAFADDASQDLAAATLSAQASTDIGDVVKGLAKDSFTYTGKALKPTIAKTGKAKLVKGVDYTIAFKNAKGKRVSARNLRNPGTYTAVIKGKGAYGGRVTDTFKIAKANNTLAVKTRSGAITLRYAEVLKGDKVINRSVVAVASNAKGKVTFAKKAGPELISVSDACDITLKRGLGAGTHKVQITAKAAGNRYYKPASKTFVIEVRLHGDIKGNISYSTGEKIYHLPGDTYYNQTQIDEEFGERWFVTEEEAIKAGWRHSYI